MGPSRTHHHEEIMNTTRTISAVILGISLASGCRDSTTPPCEGATCSALCPAGATVDWASDLARTCDVGVNVEVTIQTRGGQVGVSTRCERKGRVKFLCVPVPGDDICGERGIDWITRDQIRCARGPVP